MRALLLTAAVAVALPLGAEAADLPIPAEVEVVSPALEPEWSFNMASYFWAAGLDGDIAQFGLPTVSVSQSFGDIWDTLDFGAMAASELRYRRFGIFTDVMYVKTSDAIDTPFGLLADRVALKTEALTFTAMGEYRLVENPRGSFDAMVGARLQWVDSELRFSGDPGDPLDGVSADDSDTWVDPMIGIKGRVNIAHGFYANGWAMVGGFGVSSDIAWDVLGAVGYDFNKTFSAAIGYRALGVDYENDGFVYDVVQHGPIAGLVIRF